MISVAYRRGVHLPEHDLWLDPADAHPFAFVSHAHSDHIAAHQEVILSTGTARLMKTRLPGKRREHILPFGKTQAFRDFQATLIPAGHIFGSAQILVESAAGSLVYTGDFKLRESWSAERAEWRHAETLIMETTYGLPRYRMPPTAEVLKQMVAFCHEALDDGDVPVLLGYSLGKSQEILCALLEHELTPMLHGSVFQMTEIYRELDPEFPTGYVRYAPGQIAGKVLVCPPSAARSLMLLRVKNRRTAVLTGWALDSGAKYRYGCDAAFPLTDHADYPDLVRYVELVQPKRVLTLHGFAAAFASDLRERGFEAWALTEEDQLELSLGARETIVAIPEVRWSGEKSEAARGEESRSAMADDFAAFALLGEHIGQTSRKLAKIGMLAGYFTELAALDASLLGIAAVYLTGRAFAQTDNRTLQTGWSIIHRSLVSASRKNETQVREVARRHSDAGKTAFEVLQGVTTPQPFSLLDSRAFFEALHEARGPLQKKALLQARLGALAPLEASYLIKILTGDLRIGLKEGLVEEAISTAFSAPLDEVREANMLLGDIGETAALACRHALKQANLRLFRPIKCMLASPEPTAEAVWERLQEAARGDVSEVQGSDSKGRAGGTAPAWVEDKFDGIRAQLHVGDGRVELYSRDLRIITGQFADLARVARGIQRRIILDGELIAYDPGRNLTFFDLQKRLGRKTEDDLFLGRSDVPVTYRAFDLLLLDNESLLREPLFRRREWLEELSLPAGIEAAPVTRVSSAEEVEAAFQAARQRGNEGLIAKDGTSLYTPGRRGLAWVKLKKELATLDVVVVGAETGHGKRSGVLSDYTFAVRDDDTGEFRTIGKAYSGVTDEEIDELTEHFRSTTTATYGKYRQVRPEVVFEVAFDSVQPSDRHDSGLALRFPRIKSIRRDKTPADIDSVSYARSLVKSGQVTSDE